MQLFGTKKDSNRCNQKYAYVINGGLILEELIKEAKFGDKNSFTQIVLALEDELYKIAKTRLSCEADIDDAIQETMIQAYYSIKQLKNIECFKTWIIKILINKCNKIYRKRKKNNISYEELLIEPLSETSAQEQIDSNMNFNMLLKVLNYNERIAIVLYYGEGYTTKQISKILKTGENTIKSRIARSKSKIKDYYKGGNFNE